jgi:ribosome biogenesis protein BMS1
VFFFLRVRECERERALTSAAHRYLARRAVVLEPEEKKKLSFLHQLGAIRNEKKAKRSEQRVKRKVENQKQKRKLEEAFALTEKAKKKAKYRAVGMKQHQRQSREDPDA